MKSEQMLYLHPQVDMLFEFLWASAGGGVFPTVPSIICDGLRIFLVASDV